MPNAAVAVSMLLERYHNIHFENKMDWLAPWRGEAKEETFTPEEVDEAVERLSRRSAFREQ